MFDDAPEIVIEGITDRGEPFRPSDWAERLSGMLSVFSESGHLEYSPYLNRSSPAATIVSRWTARWRR